MKVVRFRARRANDRKCQTHREVVHRSARSKRTRICQHKGKVRRRMSSNLSKSRIVAYSIPTTANMFKDKIGKVV